VSEKRDPLGRVGIDWYLPFALIAMICGLVSELIAVTTASPWVGAIGAGIALTVLGVVVVLCEALC
jgi:hypothetical protein